MELNKKAAYLQGLVDGLGVDESTKEGKIIKAMAALLGEMADAIAAICDRAFLGEDPLPRTEKAFNAQKARARTRLPAVTQAVCQMLAAIAADYQKTITMAERHRLGATVRTELQGLVYAGF